MRTARIMQVAAVTVGTIGGLSGGTYGVLTAEARRARAVIGTVRARQLCADGHYAPDGSCTAAPPDARAPLRLAVFGDSIAAGLGAESGLVLPGVMLARGLAARSDRVVRLDTYAVSGSTAKDVGSQLDRAREAAPGEPPDVALVVVGGNDVLGKQRRGASAALLGNAVAHLRSRGTAVVAGTCPDLGTIRPIPQPLRALTSRASLALAHAQRRCVTAAGGTAVTLGDELATEFRADPTTMFGTDRFHPSGAGYRAAVAILLDPVCAAAGVGART